MSALHKLLESKVRNLILRMLHFLFEAFSPREASIAHLYTEVSPGQGRIPNTVYQTWKEPSLPSLNALGVQKFRKRNPEYSFRFFDDHQMSQYMEQKYSHHPILRVFQSLKIPAARADVWRYCILYQEGGVYCDIDSAVDVPLRDLVKDDMSELLSFENNKVNDLFDISRFADSRIFLPAAPDAIRGRLDFPDNIILNWLLCFEKRNPILEEVINLIVRHFPFFENRQFDDMLRAVIHCTGPVALTQAVWAWMNGTKKRPAQCGIDFMGHGIFKLPGSGRRYATAPHYSSLSKTFIAN